ncbi:peptidoglycan recognition family protein [Roseisolibacter sp. H3M3-2]|uniref:peptidoglycan recognition protein family protein n=1 Tax=Roseisolibacter sp. H3M3-2 TaxID=3031323 RepID=UPI0023D98FFD|nr:peptidoglycan recognition family protein [Roseisolibacter sp. H3M3-2]MDF1504976.1 peptidoglycan recognition family protein [Roseisolibacter sp. H3M3-2]
MIPRPALAAITLALAALGCRAPRATPHRLPPGVVPHARWESRPALGHAADATRRNKRAGDSLAFRDLTVTVLATAVDSSGARPADVARLRLAHGDAREERMVREGAAFNWRGHHVAVVAIYGPGELGAGLVALEVAAAASLPPEVAASDSAGGAAMRLRIPHRISHVTLHHTGDARTLQPQDDVPTKLRALQSWGASDRNWWDVPYHFLLGLRGDVYEGRDWRYQGETNTTYDPGGHFLISVVGNYERQEPTPEQLDAIADLMAWALREFDLPLDRLGGHYHYAQTGCPGQHLRRRLEDGTLRRMVEERLRR